MTAQPSLNPLASSWTPPPGGAAPGGGAEKAPARAPLRVPSQQQHQQQVPNKPRARSGQQPPKVEAAFNANFPALGGPAVPTAPAAASAAPAGAWGAAKSGTVTVQAPPTAPAPAPAAPASKQQPGWESAPAPGSKPARAPLRVNGFAAPAPSNAAGPRPGSAQAPVQPRPTPAPKPDDEVKQPKQQQKPAAAAKPPPAPVAVESLPRNNKAGSPAASKVTGFNIAEPAQQPNASGSGVQQQKGRTANSPFTAAPSDAPSKPTAKKMVSPLTKALSSQDLLGGSAGCSSGGASIKGSAAGSRTDSPVQAANTMPVPGGGKKPPASPATPIAAAARASRISTSPPQSLPIAIRKMGSRQALDMSEVDEIEEGLYTSAKDAKEKQALCPVASGLQEDMMFEDGGDAHSCSSMSSRPSLTLSPSKSLGTAPPAAAGDSAAVDPTASLEGASDCTNTDSQNSNTSREQQALAVDRDLQQLADSIQELHQDSLCASSNLCTSTRKVGLDDFQMLKVVGQGAFGKVFQVLFKRDAKVYAMKVMRKDVILQKDHSEYVKSERDLLTAVYHPYIVTLRFSFQTPSKLYLVLDFINGGHLFFNLYRQGVFDEDVARLYTAEIVSAIAYLHDRGIAHRDLKPENVLLDCDGHVRLTDFGLAKELDPSAAGGTGRTNSFIGTMEYMAPEIVEGKGHGLSVDWWSVGILLYEMLCGMPPFRAKSRQALQTQICSGKIKWPKFMSNDAQSLIKGLLSRDASKRLGSTAQGGSETIKKHAFFKTINWGKLERREIESKFKPEVTKGDMDVCNFDKIWTDQTVADSPCTGALAADGSSLLAGAGEDNFKGFTYVAPSYMLEAAR